MSQGDEQAFRRWYAEHARRYDLNPDPDSPGQFYDYRAAFRAGAKPDQSGHWPSDFKKPGHPNLIVGGFHVQTGERVPGTPRAKDAAELIRLGWDAQTANKLARMPEQQQQSSVVEIPGVGVVEFPATMTQGQIEQAAAKLYREAQNKQSTESQPAKPTPRLTGSEYTAGLPNAKRDLLAVIDALPAIGGTVGGIGGGVGGTAFGLGFGGVPGAMGGAALLGGLGEAVKQGAHRLLGRPAPGRVMDAASAIATEGAVQGATEGGGGLLTKGIGAGGRALYRGYLKPSLAGVNIQKAREIVTTALREALPVSKAGEVRAQRLIDGLNGQVNAILRNAKGTVDLKQIADRVRTWAKQKYYRPGVPVEDYQAALKVADEIDRHPSLGLPPRANPTRVDVQPVQANEAKTGMQNANRNAYGVERSAGIEARKAGAYQTRAEIEKVAPDVGPLNARESELIDAQEAVMRASGREENRNALFGVPSLIAGTVGTAEGFRQQNPAAGLTITLAIRAGLSPAIASRAAILASRLTAKHGYIPAVAARIAVEMMRGGGASGPGEQPPQEQP